jgi:hypothetical protein
MTPTQGNIVLRHIRELATAEKGTHLGDWQLLERFATGHEERPVAALVRSS